MRVSVFIGMMIIAILLIIGLFFFKTNEDNYTYTNGVNSFAIMKVDNSDYKIKIYVSRPGLDSEPFFIHTRYDPKKLEEIPVEGNFEGLLKKPHIFITLDPNLGLTSMTTIAGLEIKKFLDNKYLFAIPVNGAFTEIYGEKEDYPIRTCKDVNEKQGIILLSLGKETKVFMENNGCVVIQGKTEEEIVKAADRLAFYLLGIMN